MPDDGEWECLEHVGVVICRGGARVAGVVAGPSSEGFVCGPLSGDEERRRVCVDAAPDLPSADGWGCDFLEEGPLHEGAAYVRRCARDTMMRLGSPCADVACPEGLACVHGRCALAREAPPDCWLDGDCPEGARCVLARCTD
jgi:hypothetical protein